MILPSVDIVAGEIPGHSGEIQQEIARLGVVGRVLHIAAHPDDENTWLLAHFANEELLDTAYLSITRGDGGQNLIGPELGARLGLIRTHELLAARRLDGAKQYFTRAIDFGYSKSDEETLRIWGHEAILSDIVWVIRSFRPDVVITRFHPDRHDTHGHHTASAQLAVEAFAAAADPERFPEQLAWVEPWQAKRVVWNTARWFHERRGLAFDASGMATMSTGTFLPLLGSSTGELAAKSRSMHKSQGFGAGGLRGAQTEYFEFLAGTPMGDSIFDGISFGWERIEGGAHLQAHADGLLEAFQPGRPEASVPALLAFRKELSVLPQGPEVVAKQAAVNRLVAAALGLHVALLAPVEAAPPGASLELELELVQRRPGAVRWNRVRLPWADESTAVRMELPFNETVRRSFSVDVPPALPVSQPYWLGAEKARGLFAVEDAQLIGRPLSPPAMEAIVELEVAGEPLQLRVAAVRRRVDPIDGELQVPLRIVPPVHLALENAVYLSTNRKPLKVSVKLARTDGAVTGRLRLDLPPGWDGAPSEHPFALSESEGELTVHFEVSQGTDPQAGEIRAVAEVDGRHYSHELVPIRYRHIPDQLLMPAAAAQLVPLDLEMGGRRVAYLPGAGDSIPASLRAIGYEVTELDPLAVAAAALAPFDAVVLGIRAFNTVENIDRIMPELFRYAAEGGNVVVQYNTNHRLLTDRIAPYPLTLSRLRVTDEEAPVRFLAPDHPVLNTPNRLTPADFEGWVQERGLYFPESWDAAFTPILATADPGENPLSGGLLVAPHGDGYFVYTGYAFFRQLPEGVPGAYRLFVNLLSLGQ